MVVLTFLKPGFKYKPETTGTPYAELLRLAVPAADRLKRRWAAAAARARKQPEAPKEE